jgi:uncharacterized protein YfdQ (DUF2303 family)
MSEITEAQAVAELVHTPFSDEINGVPVVYVPTGHGNWTATFKEDLLSAPLRKKGSINIHEVDSFIEFVKKQGSLTNSNIYLDVNYAKQRILATAIFNDHSDDSQAGWRDHRAVFTPRISEEWIRWRDKNKTPMTQEEVAFFFQDNIGDINNGGDNKLPTGSDVLTFVSKLEETRTVTFGSGVNLQNGAVQLQYTEEGDSHTKGNLELFKEFGLGLRPFFGGDTYAVKAFLRYRIDRNNGNIKLWYELQRPDLVLETASNALISKIKSDTGLPIIFGEAGQ